MYRFCVFAGTAEGRALVELLCAGGAEVTACVATEYGGTLLPASERLRVSARPLPEEEIRAMLRRERFDLVIDATHPYAAHITETLARVCAEEGAEYLRLLRAGEDRPAGAVWVEDAAAAAAYLAERPGPILFTTGAKELGRFAGIPGFGDRAYARVLPMEDSLRACREAGLAPSHILAMQGPFSREMNRAMIRAVDAAFVVTKDSGAAGGFGEKAAAAAEAGAVLVVIGRPPQRAGLSYEEVADLLRERYGIAAAQVPALRPAAGRTVTHGLPDEVFLRAEGVPMTKCEVRSVCLSKLALTRDAVCWDIGAGTGSVAVEMGLQAREGHVYAVERREDAAALIGENARRLGAGNVTTVRGAAPEACAGLPAPTHVFIGGSGGRMEEIITLALGKNPGVRIVATAVTLETAAELTACLRRFPAERTEVLSLQAARGRAAGAYHLMTAQNPVYIFVMRGGEAEL